jgi:ribosomal protein L11 methyltransferase
MLIEAPSQDWDNRVQNLSVFGGFQGILELPDENSTTFSPGKGFEVLEFGSDAAKKCFDWIENDFGRMAGPRFLRLYFQSASQPRLDALIQELHAVDRDCKIISFKEEENVDYQAEFRKSFRGTQVGKRFWVGPTWESPPEGRQPIFIEPGMAFGTGDHPTTQLCISFLEEMQNPPPATVFDLGTGTGVLAVVAQRLFPQAKIWVSDLDPQCAEDFAKTLGMNRINQNLFKSYFGSDGDLRRLNRELPKIDLLISNIYAEVLGGLIDEIDACLSPGATWIVSGILEGPQSRKFIETATKAGFQLVDTRQQKRERSHFEKKNGLSLEEETWLGLKFVKVQNG